MTLWIEDLYISVAADGPQCFMDANFLVSRSILKMSIVHYCTQHWGWAEYEGILKTWLCLHKDCAVNTVLPTRVAYLP